VTENAGHCISVDGQAVEPRGYEHFRG